MDLTEKVKILPNQPGVYRFLNSEGKIIYIGKAKNLKKRVSQYFVTPERLNAKTRVLVSKIAEMEHTVVESEEDAFLLENNLIKQYQPKYNILLKDDKSYPWICIKKEAFPRYRSMSKKGYSPDNAACEGFFGRMKNECFYKHSFKDFSLSELKKYLEDYIHWYNNDRIKNKFCGLSPVKYRLSLG